MGLTFAVMLYIAGRIFEVKIDPAVAKVASFLPGLNCGACGYGSCLAAAEAIVKKEAAVELCIPGGKDSHAQIAAVLGVASTAKEKYIARLFCNQSKAIKEKFSYSGIASCAALATLQGGNKVCAFGCLGFGDCFTACKFDAIVMTEKGIPEIDPKKCVGCGMCVKACPKGIIAMVPSRSKVWIKCSSRDTGPKTVKACPDGCIACNKCVITCPEKAITIVDNLAVIDYNKCTNCFKCVEVCPRHIIFKEQ
jgi:RnfABCDGE-type electron transport complex B subunit